MTKKLDNTFVQIIHPICCGIDVHKKEISACLITVDTDGNEKYEIKKFSTFTDELIKFKNWLIEENCPVAAMESTGVYWQPIHNILESHMEIFLLNARHIKNVPGRKTDIEDSKWLAGLLRHGLSRGSFIPDAQIREWRDLTRLRRTFTKSLGDYKRRVHKLFESANIKISSVVSDLFGVTGRNIISLLSDKDTEISIIDIQNCAKGTLKSKVDELHRGIIGFFTDHHRYQLNILMETVSSFETKIDEITVQIEKLTSSHHDLLDRLD